MSTLENFKDVFFEFFKNNYNRYLLRNWVYKNETYVSDLYFEGYYLGFDLKYDGDLYVLDRVVRNYNAKDKIFSEKKLNIIKTKDSSSIISTVDTYLKDIKSKIDSNYDYKISVIIPVYNREKLILKCIDSLNNQKLDKSDFEVIFVDDFSSDKSVDIIEKLVGKDLNYKILKRPINSGSASVPRNDGILAARGKYIYFLDSDDYIYNYTLFNMVSCAEKNVSDLVYVKYSGDKGRSWGKRPFMKGNVDYASYSQNHLVRSLMCSKLVRSSILKNNDIYFPIDIKIGEDRVYMMQVLANCKNISILADECYYYITNHDGDKLTNSRSNLEHDYQVVSRVLKIVADSSLPYGNKVELLSCWHNVVVEAYILAKLRSNSHSIVDKKRYFERLFKNYCQYKEFVNSKYIYPEFQSVFNLYANGGFEQCLNLAKSK